MVKITGSPKYLELDTNMAKTGKFRGFPWQAANSAADANSMALRKNSYAAEYC